MKTNQIKDIIMKTLVYILLYGAVTLYMMKSQADTFANWYYIGMIALTSAFYLIIFLGSDSVSYRLKADSPWKERLDKLTISKVGIIVHGVIIVISILITMMIDGL